MKKVELIDKNSPIPMFFQLKQILFNKIKSGVYGVGEMIPTELELSNQYNLSRTTVRQAVLALVQEGYLLRVKGRGTFVNRQKLEYNFIQRIESFEDEMRRLNVKPGTEVIELNVCCATADIADVMKIKEGDSVIFLYRKRLADGEPIVTIKTYLPHDSCKFILKHDLERESLYSILRSKSETTVCKVNRRIEATLSNDEDTALLSMGKGQPIHHFTSVGMSSDNVVIEYSKARYRGDRSSFQVSILLDV